MQRVESSIEPMTFGY